MAAIEELEDRVARAFAGSYHISVDDVHISSVQVAGFTAAGKFIAESADGSSFLKVVDTKTHQYDGRLLKREAEIYQILQRLGLTGAIFPDYRRLINRTHGGLRILVLENLAGFKWAGPWNSQAADWVDQSLNRLHQTHLDLETTEQITRISTSIQKPKPTPKTEAEKAERNRSFLEAWDIQENGFISFINGERVIYFRGQANLPQAILEEADNVNPDPPKRLIMHDLNPFNMGISEAGVYFVDPVFLRIGDPDWDRTQVGIHLLARPDSPDDHIFRQSIIDRFITNRNMLARLIKLYVVSSGTKGQSEDWYMLHRRAAMVALEVFAKRI